MAIWSRDFEVQFDDCLQTVSKLACLYVCMFVSLLFVQVMTIWLVNNPGLRLS